MQSLPFECRTEQCGVNIDYAMGYDGAMNRAAYTARSNYRERRDVAFVSVQFPFQFPHSRYQTELSQLSHCLAGLTDRSMPEGHGQGKL